MDNKKNRATDKFELRKMRSMANAARLDHLEKKKV